jgi:hypothetical protein
MARFVIVAVVDIADVGEAKATVADGESPCE